MEIQQQNEKLDFWEQSLRENALQHLVRTFTQYTKHIRHGSVVTLVLDKQTELWMEVLVNGYETRVALNRQLGVDRLHSFDFSRIDPDFFSQFLEVEKSEVVIMLLPPLQHIVSTIFTAMRSISNAKVGGKERKYHIIWSPKASPELVPEMERYGLLQSEQTASGFSLTVDCMSVQLCPAIDSISFSLFQQTAFRDLYIHNDVRVLSQVVKSILTIEKIQNRPFCDDSILPFGKFSTMIKEMILCTRGKKTLHDERVCDETIDRVIILDRMTDPYTMFLTPMNYEGLLDAWLHTNHGEVFYPNASTDNCSKSTSTDSKSTDDSQSSRQSKEYVTSKAILSHLDPIHLALRDTNFNIVLRDKIGQVAQTLSEDACRRSEPELGVAKHRLSVTELRTLIAKIPSILKRKQALKQHLELIEHVSVQAKKYLPRESLEVEMKILIAEKKNSVVSISVQETKIFLKEAVLRNPPMNMYAFLRLLCLFCIVRGGIKAERLIWYRKQLCHSYGYDKLRVFSRLEKLGLLSSGTVWDFQKLKRKYGLKQKVLNDEETETPNDIQFLFPYTGYAPLSVRIVQSALNMDTKRLRSSFASSPISRKSASNSLRSMETILVYYIGGITVAEIAAYRFFNQSQDRHRYKVATTAICNGTQVLCTL